MNSPITLPTCYSPIELNDIAAIAQDLAALAAENPDAHLPRSAEAVYLAERMGLIWDFTEKRWQPGPDPDTPIHYALTPRALALIAEEA